MPGSWPAHELPNLNQTNCFVTSNASNRYNCIAWAAGDLKHNWWPDSRGIGYWPVGVPRRERLEAFVAAFWTVGFLPCNDGSLEPGIEKLALYARKVGEILIPTHAALQLEDGEWTSKLGPFEDIVHKTVKDVSGPVYGDAEIYLARKRPPSRSLGTMM